MAEDENTARGHRGPGVAVGGPAPAVRSTAPAGTPYPVVPNPPPAVPAPSASQPRTVGGHTARLVVPEDDVVDFDPLGSSSLPVALVDPADAVPVSTTMGGTQRLQTVSPETAAVAEKEVAQQEAEKKAPDARKRPAPTVDMPVVLEDARSSPAAPAAHRGSSALALLFAPTSVAVGLVFFAMGSMLTLTVEGRLIHFTVTSAIETVSAPAPSPSGTAGPTHTAGTPAVALTPQGSVTTPPAASSGKPATPPATVRPQGGTPGSGKRPPIIF